MRKSRVSRTKKKKTKKPRDADAQASLQGDVKEKVRDASSRTSTSAEVSLDSITSAGDNVVADERRILPIWYLWKYRPDPILKKIGVYALVIFGAYWILAAWFSSWGDTWLGSIWWTFVGVVLIYAGVISQAERAPRSVVLEAAKINIRSGAIWCVGGVVVTVGCYIFVLYNGGVYYAVYFGPIVFGGIQLLHGLAQKHGLIHVK